jgi:hypothetical protein
MAKVECDDGGEMENLLVVKKTVIVERNVQTYTVCFATKLYRRIWGDVRATTEDSRNSSQDVGKEPALQWERRTYYWSGVGKLMHLRRWIRPEMANALWLHCLLSWPSWMICLCERGQSLYYIALLGCLFQRIGNEVIRIDLSGNIFVRALNRGELIKQYHWFVIRRHGRLWQFRPHLNSTTDFDGTLIDNDVCPARWSIRGFWLLHQV